MQPITINGIKLLTEKEKQITNNLLNEYYPRLQKLIKNEISLRVYIKEHEKQGKRKVFSISIEILSASKNIKAKYVDWDFARTLHKVLNKLLNESEKRFKASEQK